MNKLVYLLITEAFSYYGAMYGVYVCERQGIAKREKPVDDSASISRAVLVLLLYLYPFFLGMLYNFSFFSFFFFSQKFLALKWIGKHPGLGGSDTLTVRQCSWVW